MGTGSTIQLTNDKPINYQLEIQHKELPVTNGLVLARLCYFDRSYICKPLQHFPKLEIMYIHTPQSRGSVGNIYFKLH